MDLRYDGAIVTPQSPIGKELLKWERKPDWTPEKNPFPKMLYRAELRPDGKRSVGEVLDSLFGGAPGAAEQWSRRCQLTVQDETEMQRAMERGYRKTPGEALELLEAKQNAISNETAERHYKEKTMSHAAQSEAAVVDDSTLKQVPSIDAAALALAKEKKRASLAKAREAKAAKNAAG